MDESERIDRVNDRTTAAHASEQEPWPQDWGNACAKADAVGEPARRPGHPGRPTPLPRRAVTPCSRGRTPETGFCEYRPGFRAGWSSRPSNRRPCFQTEPGGEGESHPPFITR